MKALLFCAIALSALTAQAVTLTVDQKIMCETDAGATLKIVIGENQKATLTFSSQWQNSQSPLSADISQMDKTVTFSVSGLEMIFEETEIFDGQEYHPVLQSQNGYVCAL